MFTPENSPQSPQSKNPPALNLPQEGDSSGFIQWFNLMKNPPEALLQAWAKAVARIREKNRKPRAAPIQNEGSQF